jgi:hypothetical protein
MIEVFSYIAIISILLTGIIPMVAGIIQTIKENKQLDREREYRESKKTVL